MARVQSVTCDRCGRRTSLERSNYSSEPVWRKLTLTPLDYWGQGETEKEVDLCGRCTGDLTEFLDISQAVERGLVEESESATHS